MEILTQMQPYQWVQNSGQGYIVLPRLSAPGVFHFFGTRLLSESALYEAGSGRPGKAIRVRQVHGDRIWPVSEADAGRGEGPEPRLIGDALATDRSHLLITVSTADCVPVLLFDPVQRAVSAIHAGWRGTSLNISGKAVREMVSRYGSEPSALLAGIGPCIGPCCYEVGEDVWGELERKYSPGPEVVIHEREGKAKLDLARLNALQLAEAGLNPDKIAFSGLCTSCLPGLFYSFRRDKKRVGNMTSGIMLIDGT